MSSTEVLSHHSVNEMNIDNQEESPTTYQPSLDENVNVVYTQTSQKSDPKNSNESPTLIVANVDTIQSPSSPEEVPRITEPILRKAISDVQNDLLNSDWSNSSPKKSHPKNNEPEKRRLARMQQLAKMEEKLRNISQEGYLKWRFF